MVGLATAAESKRLFAVRDFINHFFTKYSINYQSYKMFALTIPTAHLHFKHWMQQYCAHCNPLYHQYSIQTPKSKTMRNHPIALLRVQILLYGIPRVKLTYHLPASHAGASSSCRRSRRSGRSRMVKSEAWKQFTSHGTTWLHPAKTISVLLALQRVQL